MTIKQKIEGLNHAQRAVLVTLPVSSVLLIYLLSIGAADLVFSEWFLTLISVPSFCASHLVSSGYFGRLVDLFKRGLQKKPQTNRNEFIWTVIGLCAGIAVGVGLSVMQIPVPLTSSLFIFANVLFIFRQINVFAGFGSRVGKCVDTGDDSLPVSEKIAIGTAGFLGLTLGIILFATRTAAMISVVGVTAFFAGGAVIPAWIAGMIFVVSVASGLASSADYAVKGINFIRAQFIAKGKVTATVSERPYEYLGSLLGVMLGLVIGAIIIGAIVLTNPVILAGMVGAITGALILTTCVGIMGSLFSHGGRLIDGYKRKLTTNSSDDNLPEDELLLRDRPKGLPPSPTSSPTPIILSRMGFFSSSLRFLPGSSNLSPSLDGDTHCHRP